MPIVVSFGPDAERAGRLAGLLPLTERISVWLTRNSYRTSSTVSAGRSPSRLNASNAAGIN
jgi:hypothetical protein